MAILISAEHLSRYYGKHCAIKDVSFTLAQGEVLGFLGPNGAGKTTTMQILSGNLAASSGRVEINGYDLQDQAKLAKLNIGYLPDTPPLYKDLSVQEFLYYCAQLHGIPKKSIHLAVLKAQERCGLITVSNRLIANLSKGYQQRIGIAQAIIHNPDVIILDEPTVGLDPLQIREIRDLILELGHDHGIILSTHTLSEVQAVCTHVQIIHQGQLILKESIDGLNQQMDTASILISTRLKPDLAVLSALAGVLNIEAISDQQFKITYRLRDNPTQRLIETIISSGWELQEFTPIKRSMEDIFITLTQHND